MAQTTPKLVTFGSSLYCEKARWALDWHGIAYEEIGWPPGLHIILAKRYGAKATTLPILLDGETLVQGSGAIVDWADRKARDPAQKLTLADASEIEQRADDVIGVHMRRLLLAETLPSRPHVMKPAMLRNTSSAQRVIGTVMWPVSRRVMMRMYDIAPEAAAESRSKLDAELAWLDGKLADNRTYLSGDRFSRADLSVASMLAPVACPEEIPAYRDMKAPDALIADAERWRGRPVMRFVAEHYKANRAPKSKDGAARP